MMLYGVDPGGYSSLYPRTLARNLGDIQLTSAFPQRCLQFHSNLIIRLPNTFNKLYGTHDRERS